ncbi:PEP-CTERM sorting domain-containing protein [bacterium]|nr:MAG: PEP-CTERM sorting domain-containing protein [bacterium]
MKLFVSFALVATLSAAASANLVVNGDFESDSYPAGNYQVITGSFTGWTVIGGNVAGLGAGYLSSPSQEIDLSGTIDTSGTGITQNIATLAGQSYELTAQIYAGAGFTPYTGGVDVLVDGITVATNVQGTNSIFSYTFTAGSSTDITFLSNNGNVSHIDNVTLNAVPEPASMAALGLGGLALLRRRRKA